MNINDQQKMQRLIWLGIVFIYVVIRIQPTGIPLDRDEGVFGMIGNTILQGGLPYLDGIDHKPPVIFYIYALILSILPPTAVAIHLFLHFYNFLTLIVMFLFVRDTAGLAVAYWAALIYAVISINPYMQGFTASTEMFMLMPMMLSIWLAQRATKLPEIKYNLLFGSGLAGAIACWCKQPAVFGVITALILVVHNIWILNERKQRNLILARAIGVWLAGGISITIIIVGYFAANGLFNELMYWSFKHNVLYSSGISITDKLEMSIPLLLKLVMNIPLVFVLVVASFFMKFENLNAPKYILITFLLMSLLAVNMGFAYLHYYAQLLPAITILAAISMHAILNKQNIVKSKLVEGVAVVVLVASILLPNLHYHFLGSPHVFIRMFFGIDPFPESISIANYLNKNTEANDKILLFGSEPQILLMSRRQSATPFFMIYPLMRSEFPGHLNFQQQVIADTKAADPKYIVLVNLSTSLLYDGKAKLPVADFLNEYLPKHYFLEDQLFYNNRYNSWRTQSDEAMKQGDIRPGISIQLFKRNS